MSKIGQRFNPAVFQQASNESTGKSKGKDKSSSSSKSEGSSESGKSEGKGGIGGGADGLPSVGLGGPIEQADAVEQYMGNGGATYTDDAVDQHNEIGTKAARGQLLGQNNHAANPQNKQLLREVDTLKARLAQLEGKIQTGGVQETAATQGVQRVAGGARQVGRAFGSNDRREASLQAQNVEAIKQKQGSPLDDDLPRVGLK